MRNSWTPEQIARWRARHVANSIERERQRKPLFSANPAAKATAHRQGIEALPRRYAKLFLRSKGSQC